MTWSLNEIEGLARKAARGAGMGWGPAEEAGRATRWLCAAGWPGAEALAALLAANDGVPWQSVRPDTARAPWQAPAGPLCPVAAGTALCDRAGEWAAGATARLGPTARPLLLVPFMALAAEQTGVCVTRAGGRTLAQVRAAEALRTPLAEAVQIGPAGPCEGRRVTRAYRGEVPGAAARRLRDLAHRTYAPATPESRRAGAGAGLTDTD